MKTAIRLSVVLVAYLGLAVGGAPASADVHPSGPVPTPKVAFTTTATSPGSSFGVHARITFPASRTGRPYSVNSVGVAFPEGTRIDRTAIPVCRASDVDLYLRGTALCAESRLGTATAKVDFMGPGSEVLGGPYEEFLLGDGEIIIFEYNQLRRPGPDGATLAPLIFRAPLTDRGFTMVIPEGPSLALPDLLWALKSVDLTFADTGVFRLPTKTTSEKWDFDVRFGYYVGTQQSVRIQVPVTG